MSAHGMSEAGGLRECRIEGCPRPVESRRDICGTHRTRLRRGTPLNDESLADHLAEIRELWASLIPDMGAACIEWPGARDKDGYFGCKYEPADASTSAGEGLSEDVQATLSTLERHALAACWNDADGKHKAARWDEVLWHVERIVAAREAKARAEAGEQIAQAIEEAAKKWPAGPSRADYAECARIAIEVTR